jgi:hypothetical protein
MNRDKFDHLIRAVGRIIERDRKRLETGAARRGASLVRIRHPRDHG